MSICEQLAESASVDVKALVFAEYHNNREACYKEVENHCNNNGVYTDGSIAEVMRLIYENFNI
jgi:hypothetical protein